MSKLWNILWHLILLKKDRKETLIQLCTHVFSLGCCLPLSLFFPCSPGYVFKTVSSVLPLRLSRILTEIKWRTATGCSAHSVDEAIWLQMTPENRTLLPGREISVDPREWPVAGAHSIQRRAKVVSTARNYRLCAFRTAHRGAASCWLNLETMSNSSRPPESAAAQVKETLW